MPGMGWWHLPTGISYGFPEYLDLDGPVCNKSELSGAETGNLLMQVLSDSSRYVLRNTADAT